MKNNGSELYFEESNIEAFIDKLERLYPETILEFPIDHSFLKYKKELLAYGYQVVKIFMKEETVGVERVRL